MAGLFTPPFFDVGSGIKPADGAKLFFNIVGSDTDKDTYTTAAGTSGPSHANPVIANSVGVFDQIFIIGDYDWILTDKNDVQIDTGFTSETLSALIVSNLINYNFTSIANMITGTTVSGDVVIAEVGQTWSTNQFFANLPGVGGWDYRIIAEGTYDGTEPVLKEGVHWFTITGGLQAVMEFNFPIPIEAMGMRPDLSSNLVGAEQRLPHCIAVGDVTHGAGQFLHVGNLPTPTKVDLQAFLELIGRKQSILSPTQVGSEYSFTWKSVMGGTIVLDLSTTDNNGKSIGFYLSHTDINDVDYTNPLGAWGTFNSSGFQRNITLNGFEFLNKAWVPQGNDSGGNPAPDSVDAPWWSTHLDNSIGMCINYSSNVNLDNMRVSGFTCNRLLYVWASAWQGGKDSGSEYSTCFVAGTTTAWTAPFTGGVKYGYRIGSPDFLVGDASWGGIKMFGLTLISPACDGVSNTAYDLRWGTSVTLIQPKNEGTKVRMFDINDMNGQITIQDLDYLSPGFDRVKFPISEIIRYNIVDANLFGNLVVQNMKQFANTMLTGGLSKAIFVEPLALQSFLSRTVLINCSYGREDQWSNLDTQVISSVQLEKPISFIRNAETTPTTNNFSTFPLATLISMAEKYESFSDSMNEFDVTIAFARSVAFDRFTLNFRMIIYRGASGLYQDFTITDDTLAYYINGSGGSGTTLPMTVTPTYDGGSGLLTIEVFRDAAPAEVFERISSRIVYVQSC